MFDERRAESQLLRELWEEHEKWRDDIRKIVHRCLEQLKTTGWQKGRRPDFRALFIAKDWRAGFGPESVILPGTAWLGLLEDTYESPCFAVMTEDCLEVEGHNARLCQHAARANRGPTQGTASLGTALVFNAPPVNLLQQDHTFQGRDPPWKLKFADGRYLQVTGVSRSDDAGRNVFGLHARPLFRPIQFGNCSKVHEAFGDEEANVFPLIIEDR